MRRAALGPHPPFVERVLVDACDAVRTGNVGRLAVDLPANQAHDRLLRLVLRTHERERVLRAEVPLPHVEDPVGIRMLERSLRQRIEQRADPLCEAAHHRVRERNRPLEVCGAYQLHRLVHGRVRRDLEVAELVRAEAKRGEHRRVELAHRSAAERLDRVIERPDALHRSVRDPLRKRAVALVELLARAAERAVRVCVVLEDAAHDVVRCAPCR